MQSTKKKTTEFNLRVYGLVINFENEILLTDEYRMGQFMTKFPGGGLEKGEGTIDCLRREFKEETGLEITDISHYYTTDFYQKGWYYANMQLISIYYTAQLKQPGKLKISSKPFDFDKADKNPQSFRWEAITSIKPEDLTFPIDQIVIKMLKGDLKKNYNG